MLLKSSPCSLYNLGIIGVAYINTNINAMIATQIRLEEEFGQEEQTPKARRVTENNNNNNTAAPAKTGRRTA